MRRRLLLAAATVSAAALAPPPLRAQAPSAPPPPVVFLVRHAEKAPTPGSDPALSPAGEARARDLAAALRDAGVTRVIVTQFQRTRLTAAPLLAALGVAATVVPAGPGDVAPHAAAVAAAARGAAGPVLVVGHSNTVGPIAAALGAPRTVRICDAQYATLLAVIPAASGPSRLVRASYGAADPAVDERCAVVPAPAR